VSVEEWEAEMFEVWEAADALRDRDAETRADIRRYRHEMGLPADAATVDWFFRQDAAGEQFLGTWLTAEEEAALDSRQAQLDAGAAAVAAYVETHREVFAGRWVRHTGGVPIVVVGFTRDVDRHRRALAEIHPHPGVVEVVGRRNTLAALEALMERTEEFVDKLAERGISWDSIGIDEENNRVDLELVASDESVALRLIAERLGDDVAVVFLGSEKTTVQAVAWHLWSLDDSGRGLTVHYSTNAAYEPHSVEHDEDDRSVKVTVFERMPTGFTRLAGATRHATVTLDRPLGDRVVTDASTGEQRPQRRTDSRPR
jgi:hypothetical protein